MISLRMRWETFEGNEKRLLKEVMYLLQGEQWIMSSEFPDQIWKSAQGQRHGTPAFRGRG